MANIKKTTTNAKTSTESSKKSSGSKASCTNVTSIKPTLTTSKGTIETKNVKTIKDIASDNNKFPRQELLKWLSGRSNWNHQDWLGLLNDLKSKGFGHLTDSYEGQAKIGEFLESNRMSVAS